MDTAVAPQGTALDDLLATARRVLPEGHFGNVALPGIVISHGRAGRVWDEAGAEYVDYLIGSGPMVVGHCHPAVDAAVRAQLERGTTFFATSAPGIHLAAAIVDAVPCAEQVRFVSSGTEADAYAMRLARAVRGRDKILKFEGGYHGMSDWAMMSLAPRTAANFPNPIPDSPGIPASLQNEVLVSPFNDLDAAVALIRAHADEIGGVIVEPCQRILPPLPGFLQGLRDITAELGIPLIFDEVVTGFRYAYGGAQEYYGVVPDLCTLGKLCGGGFPLAAVAGRADMMALLDREAVGEDRFLPMIGTLSGNPVAAAAGLATLAIMRAPGAYDTLFATGRALMDGLRGLLHDAGHTAAVVGEPPMFDIVFADGPIRTYRDLQRADKAKARRLNAALRGLGVLKGEGKHYIALAHTADDLAHTLDAYRRALAALG